VDEKKGVVMTGDKEKNVNLVPAVESARVAPMLNAE
jgi:hypothetical protein